MSALLEMSILNSVGIEVFISIGSGIVSIVGAYIIIRERILKTEMRLNSIMEYIDRKNEILDNKIRELREDIEEFKQLNKETSKSLIENTTAIRELKLVLNMLREQLGVKGQRKIKSISEDEI